MHKIEHRVIYGDTDAGQVVYYANYFRWFESGRTELLKGMGISYAEVERQGMILPVVEAHCSYMSPAMYDDVIIVETKISEIKDKSIKFEYAILRKNDSKALAAGYTINVFVDKKKMKAIPIPEDIREKLNF